MNADNGIWSLSSWFCYCMVHILFNFMHCVDNFSRLYSDLVYHFGNNIHFLPMPQGYVGILEKFNL